MMVLQATANIHVLLSTYNKATNLSIIQYTIRRQTVSYSPHLDSTPLRLKMSPTNSRPFNGKRFQYPFHHSSSRGIHHYPSD